jgi:hypothetical protein
MPRRGADRVRLPDHLGSFLSASLACSVQGASARDAPDRLMTAVTCPIMRYRLAIIPQGAAIPGVAQWRLIHRIPRAPSRSRGAPA